MACLLATEKRHQESEITKCGERTKHSVWMHGADRKLTLVTCACEITTLRETMLPSEFPCRLWSILAADLDCKLYLVIVDHFLSFLEFAKLTLTTSELLHAMVYQKGCMLTMDHYLLLSVPGCSHRTGVSAIWCQALISHRAMKRRSALCGLSKIFSKSHPHLALMAYRAANGYSPSELLGREIGTPVPVVHLISVQSKKELSYRPKQWQNYNHRHKAHNMVQL